MNTLHSRRRNLQVLLIVFSAASLFSCGGGGGGYVSGPGQGPGPGPMNPPTTPIPVPVNGPPWASYARDPQHTANSQIASQNLTRIIWQTTVDFAPTYNGGALLAHYGSPVITSTNTILIPIKTTALGAFRVDAKIADNQSLTWTANSDYVAPTHNWFPTYNLALTSTNRVYFPGAGGKLFYRDDVNSATGTVQQIAFFGNAAYTAAAATYNATVFINTPLTVDSQGTVYFGFIVTGANPANLVSGIARIAADGTGTARAAALAASDAAISKVAMNSAPALSNDGSTVYVAVTTAPPGQPRGYLLALNSLTLATNSKVALVDPATGAAARISDDSTASPTVGPDGDVYYGVLESNGQHNARGWLLHFDATLATTKIPGSFGWDDTPSIVPANIVTGYTGTSPYLVMTKYNNYANTAPSGNGQNRIALLDPRVSQNDPVASTVQVMKEVITRLSPSADPTNAGIPGAVTEWCINTGAVDPFTKSMLVNNEDGVLYRWDFTTNTFSQSIRLNNGLFQAYTPTIIGPDGVVYAMSNGVLFAIGQ